MKRVALACWLLLASCSERTEQVSVKVESEGLDAGGGSVQRSVEVEIGNDPGRPADPSVPLQEDTKR